MWYRCMVVRSRIVRGFGWKGRGVGGLVVLGENRRGAGNLAGGSYAWQCVSMRDDSTHLDSSSPPRQHFAAVASSSSEEVLFCATII